MKRNPAQSAPVVSRTALVLSWALAAAWPGPAGAYHPLNTDDPGTTEFRHFELEWGSNLTWPEDGMDEATGYAAVKSGLGPGLELDTSIAFVYGMTDEAENRVSGWGDGELLLKWRFFGDGDEPDNLGLKLTAALPSGEAEKGLRGGDEIVPAALIFGTAGQDRLRLLFNAGMAFLPDENDVMLHGLGLEWAASERTTLTAEIYGESDFEREGNDNPLEAVVGALYSPQEELTLSAGAAAGLTEASPNYYFTFAVLLGW